MDWIAWLMVVVLGVCLLSSLAWATSDEARNTPGARPRGFVVAGACAWLIASTVALAGLGC